MDRKLDLVSRFGKPYLLPLQGVMVSITLAMLTLNLIFMADLTINHKAHSKWMPVVCVLSSKPRL